MKIRTWMQVFVVFSALLALTSCGSGGDANTSDLTTAEITSLSSDLSTGMTAAMANFGNIEPEITALTRNATRDIVIRWVLSGEQACQLGGHITWSGNVTAVGTETSASVTGQVTFQISDLTNNLNDCEVAQDVIVTGTLYLMFSGTEAGASASLNGTISVNSHGPSGGLVPRGSCSVNLAVQRGATRATGSVCGQAVS
ncbi:MAG: hypothetical protein V1798_10385 [Pseudomonadota bacterium]